MTRLFSLTLASALLGGALLALTAAPVCAQNYILTNTTIDGSSPITGDIVVGQDSTGTVNTSPTVNILTDASVNYVSGYNSSITRLNGATVNDVYFYNNSTFNVVSGILRNHIYAYDNSTTNFLGGALALDLRTSGNSRVTFIGGSIGQNLQTGGNSVLNFTGGTVARGSEFADNSAVTISGGSFGQNVGINYFLDNNSSLTLRGYNVTITDIGLKPGFGEEFALGGQLADGTDLTSYRLIKTPGFTGSVTLVEVPESGNLALLAGLSLTGIAFLRRRKSASKAL